jgi:hypothetical protein
MDDASKNRRFLQELNRLSVENLDCKSNLKIKVLYEEEAIHLALKYQYTLKSIYVEAMKLGVCPYRYIRNRESISIQDQISIAESRIAVVGSGGLGGM